MFGCSPDDIVIINGTGMHGISGRGIVEYKCPFKGGYPSHYKQIPACYYMQMQLNMKATNSDWCHFVTWTPKTVEIDIVIEPCMLIYSDVIAGSSRLFFIARHVF